MKRKILVTGSNGLIGSELSAYFAGRGWKVFGVDNNMRARFFGKKGDTGWVLKKLLREQKNYSHIGEDIRKRSKVAGIVRELRPDAIVHAAAQPSHDLAAKIPFRDFDVNAVGTLNLLEAARRFSPDAPFVHFSTNKVYGDRPNGIPLVEKRLRWDYRGREYAGGINEEFPIDQSMHSLFGASKVAADVMVQEYGRYFGMPTCCLRGGCLTGPNHSGVELHGFLSYLIRCNVKGTKYTIIGYKGKQVRDNIHSHDVARFCDAFIAAPRVAEVYNLGGGRGNSISVLEAIEKVEGITGRKMITDYSDVNRAGDHICYISDLTKIRSHYPSWDIEKDLDRIFAEIHESWLSR